ncbi:MAG TPA: hypothetical protein PLK30_00530 [Blastocatellia bacterium]|nr:hypothetical protein [Blastocatellia bacterium]
MKRNSIFAFSLLVLTALFAVEGLAQEVFEDPDGKYSMSLPTGWLGIVNKDGLGRNEVNIVYKVRENGALKIRRIEDADGKMEVMAYANKDESERIRFNPKYDKISLEKFVIGAGKSGALLAYDYFSTSGQPFTGRIYYLRTDEKTLYVLQFTGRKNILGTLRSHTDAIARSFKVK